MNVDPMSLVVVDPREASVPIFTSFAQVDDTASDDDRVAAAIQDLLFRNRVAEVLRDHMPWLPSLLAAAGAGVVAGRGRFWFSLNSSGEFFEIPELGALLQLLPWVEDGDTPH